MKKLLNTSKYYLTNLVKNPNKALGTCSILSFQERQDLVKISTGPQKTYFHGQLIHQLIDEQAKQTPDNSAIVFGSDTISYSTLQRRAQNLSNFLKKCGIKPENKVALLRRTLY